MGAQTGRAVLDAIFCVCKIAAAFVTQRIERAVAEHAAEGLRISAGMTGKILTASVLKKNHDLPYFYLL